METGTDYFLGLQKSLQIVTAAMKLKDACSLEEKLDKSSQHIKKQRHYFADKVKVKLISRVQFFVTPWTVAHQAPLSVGFSRQEYWSGLPFPSPGDLPDPGIELGSPALQADFTV